MKRFHVHAHVEDIQASIAFYSRVFAAESSRVESDYAKLMLDDPRINFAISTRGGKLGVDHLGIQTDTEEELVELEVASFILNLLTSLRQFEEAPSSYPQPYPQLESCRQERVCQSHTGIAEVGCMRVTTVKSLTNAMAATCLSSPCSGCGTRRRPQTCAASASKARMF